MRKTLAIAWPTRVEIGSAIVAYALWLDIGRAVDRGSPEGERKADLKNSEEDEKSAEEDGHSYEDHFRAGDAMSRF